jgi:integrase
LLGASRQDVGLVPGACTDHRRRRTTQVQSRTPPDRAASALVDLLTAHREEQECERAVAGSLWIETGVFTNELGQAIKPDTDYHAWKAPLKRAGVRDGRLHDARHTAATVLLLLGVPERTVMGIMGWSSTNMAARYQHVSDPIRRSVAKLVDGLIRAQNQPS